VVGCGGGVTVGAASGGVEGLVVRAPTPRAASVVGLAPWEALPWRLCRGSRHAEPCCRLPSPSWRATRRRRGLPQRWALPGRQRVDGCRARPGRRSAPPRWAVGTSRGCGGSHDGGERHRVGGGVVGGAVGGAVGDDVVGLAARGRVWLVVVVATGWALVKRAVGVGGVAPVAPPCSHFGGLAEVEAVWLIAFAATGARVGTAVVELEAAPWAAPRAAVSRAPPSGAA